MAVTLKGGRIATDTRSFWARRNEAIFNHPMSMKRRKKTQTALLKGPAIRIRLITVTELSRVDTPISQSAGDFFLIFHELFKGELKHDRSLVFLVPQKTCLTRLNFQSGSPISGHFLNAGKRNRHVIGTFA
ncbi:MAG TPA: hypothetical protein VKR53_10295 [Puia sp.]|nr:hypothetical protein [Puia sp.]